MKIICPSSVFPLELKLFALVENNTISQFHTIKDAQTIHDTRKNIVSFTSSSDSSNTFTDQILSSVTTVSKTNIIHQLQVKDIFAVFG